jgi:hypothetical protein
MPYLCFVDNNKYEILNIDGTYHFVYQMQVEDAWRSTEVILWNGYDAYRWVEYAFTGFNWQTRTIPLQNLKYCFR